MKLTIRAKQDIEFKIPGIPTHIATTNGQIALSALSDDVIENIFEQMKQNALDQVRAKDAMKTTGPSAETAKGKK